jgi:hypothetical protein
MDFDNRIQINTYDFQTNKGSEISSNCSLINDFGDIHRLFLGLLDARRMIENGRPPPQPLKIICQMMEYSQKKRCNIRCNHLKQFRPKSKRTFLVKNLIG